MRFSPDLNVQRIPELLARFLAITGADPWIKRYRSLRSEMQANPLLRPYFAERHGLELRLGQILTGERKRPDPADPGDYALLSFVAMVVLIYDRLTDLGKKRVAGSLRDGLNSTDRGLRPFKAEIETVTHLMGKGFDVSFQDIDHGGGFDFLATRDGIELEVECKSVSGDLGRQIHHRRMIGLSWYVWPIVQPRLASLDGGRLIRVLLPARLHGRPELLEEIAETTRSVLHTGTSVSTDACSVESREFDLAGTPFGSTDPTAVTQDAVQDLLDRELGHGSHHVFFGFRPGRSVVALAVESRKPDSVVGGLMRDLKTAAKTQFTGERPAVLVVQFLELSAANLLELASHDTTDPTKAPALQLASNLFFENPARSHIHTLIYRAQSELRVSVATSADRVDRHYQEQGPTYGFKNPNHPLRNDPRYSLFPA